MAVKRSLSSLELFTGAGGLALGVAEAGYHHEAVVEWNHDACCSLRDNSTRLRIMRGWPIFEQDVRDYDFTCHTRSVDLIAAGAPCQPFSLGGKHGGFRDDRNMFPEVFRAVREVLPPVVVVENVKGLLRTAFQEYFDYIVAALTAPEILEVPGKGWQHHKARLDVAIGTGKIPGARYNVSYQLVNAANYGVPQRRERVFIVAFREDVNVTWTGLRATHSEDALLHAKWISGDYWKEHHIRPLAPPTHLATRLQRLRSNSEALRLPRWRTVRDALEGLPEPVDYKEHPLIHNHAGNPGARSYPGHTGSLWDEPSKTLKAGDHGVPGGENMLRSEDGSVRYLTVREAARIQTFPDDYVFKGAWSEGFRQLGNAVPVRLAAAVAKDVRRILNDSALETRAPSRSKRVA